MYDDAKRILARLEAGDLRNPRPPAPTAAAVDAVARQVRGRARKALNKTVMVVESKTEMQDLLRDRLKKHGYRVLVFSDWHREPKRFEDDEHQPADCVMFCAQYLGAEALDGFNEFGAAEATKEIPALLFADGKQTEPDQGSTARPASRAADRAAEGSRAARGASQAALSPAGARAAGCRRQACRRARLLTRATPPASHRLARERLVTAPVNSAQSQGLGQHGKRRGSAGPGDRLIVEGAGNKNPRQRQRRARAA